jgi:hypothetical protein
MVPLNDLGQRTRWGWRGRAGGRNENDFHHITGALGTFIIVLNYVMPVVSRVVGAKTGQGSVKPGQIIS